MEKQNKKSSKQRIKEALLKGQKLTNLIAFQSFGTTDFRKRISELKLEGGLPIQSKYLDGNSYKTHWIEQQDLPKVEKRPFVGWFSGLRLGFGG